MILIKTEKFQLTKAGEKEFAKRAAAQKTWPYDFVQRVLTAMLAQEGQTAGVWFKRVGITSSHHYTPGDSKLKPLAGKDETPRHRRRREKEEAKARR